MSESPHIFSVTQDDFDEQVLEQSKQVPVLVDYWAPWCAPCRTLTPILDKLVDEAQGGLLLAKVNTDEQQELAMQHGVRSLPTVKLLKDGQLVDEFMGAQPEEVVRKFLAPHLPQPTDSLLDASKAALARGDVDTALEALRRGCEEDPKNHEFVLALAEVLVQKGDLDEAEAQLARLAPEHRDELPAGQLRACIEFARVTRDAPAPSDLESTVRRDPEDSKARYQLSAFLVQAGHYEDALQHLLEIVRRDPRFGDDAGRKGMLAVFTLLGGKGAVVSRFRNRMFALLH